MYFFPFGLFFEGLAHYLTCFWAPGRYYGTPLGASRGSKDSVEPQEPLERQGHDHWMHAHSKEQCGLPRGSNEVLFGYDLFSS